MQLTTSDRKRISLQAAIWLSVIEDIPSQDQCSQFTAWLEESPLHADAFLEVAGHFADVLPPLEVERAANEALEPEIPSWISEYRQQDSAAYHRRIRWIPASAGLVMSLVVAAGLYSFWPHVPHRDRDIQITYADAGIFQLGRNSTMTLDSQSKAEVQRPRGSNETLVHVIKGHAAFSGDHNPSAPFRVLSNNVVVDVLGTSFDVYEEDNTTTIKVTHGKVHVASYCRRAAGSNTDGSFNISGIIGSEADLNAGQIVKVSETYCSDPLLVQSIQNAAFQQPASSSSEWIGFKTRTVQETVEEFNRHGVHIVVSDPDLGSRRIASSFQPSQVESFIRILIQDYNARVRRDTAADGSKVIYLSLTTGK